MMLNYYYKLWWSTAVQGTGFPRLRNALASPVGHEVTGLQVTDSAGSSLMSINSTTTRTFDPSASSLDDINLAKFVN